MSAQQPQRIDIFISSPSDLYPERAELKRTLEKMNLDPEFVGTYTFIVFLWEVTIKEEDLQGYDWQQYINLFGQNLTTSHVVIGMLWSRLGLELKHFVNPITGRPYRSGTEYELSTACDAERQHGLPKVLFYQCNRTVAIPEGDDPQAVESRRQKQWVQQFIQELQDEQMIAAPVSTFSTPVDLISLVLNDLRRILPEILQRLKLGAPKVSTLPALPIDFVPRNEDIVPIVVSVRMHSVTLLHGLPGQGKTVMARAICDEVAQDFHDGILWATFGQQADLMRILREWIFQLHGDLAQTNDVASAQMELIRNLQGRQYLLICDDVWQTDDAQIILKDLPATCCRLH
jgi:hypothetical protein